MAQYAKDFRDGKKSRRTPWSEFKMENSLTPTLTPAVRQLRKRPSSKEDIVAILVERGNEHNPLGNFQDLKKLIPIDAAGFLGQDCLGTCTHQQMRWRTYMHQKMRSRTRTQQLISRKRP